jgi:erythromycin esterase
LPAISDAAAFKASLQPIVDQIGNHRIIALGEATHGTKEFTVLRTLLSQMLVEQKGFNIICLENPYGNTCILDSLLNTTADLNNLMHETLLSIYQTVEFKDFLLWLQSFNHPSKKVQLAGIDFVEIKQTARILQQQLAGFHNEEINRLTDSIVGKASFHDSIWSNMNKSGFKYDSKAVIRNGYYLYKQLDRLENLLKQDQLYTSAQVSTAILNCRHGVAMFYNSVTRKRTASRDEQMAEIVNRLAQRPDARIIIWAHNAHSGYEAAFNTGENGGGMGKFIKEKNPDYFVIGTSTATGTYSATSDRFDTKDNRFSTYRLKRPDKKSWEKYFATLAGPAFYIDTKELEKTEQAGRLHKLIGYRPESKSLTGNYTNVAINRLYDAVIFIKETNASDHRLK